MHFQEICELHLGLKDMSVSSDFEIRHMAEKMKSKFDKYWGHPHKMNKLIFFANVLDPSYKFQYMKFSLITMFGDKQGEALFDAIKNEMTLLFEWYKSLYDSSSIATNIVTSQVDLSQSQLGQSVLPTNSLVVRKPVSTLKAKFRQHL